MQVVGFLDDDRKKLGMNIGGIKVLGGLADLQQVLTTFRIEELVIAMINAPGSVLTEILQQAQPLRIQPRMMGQVRSGVQSRGPLALLRPLELGDLLKRKPRTMDLEPLQKLIQGRRVLVTGAGGSIGSEISRQVMSFGPSKLLLLDHSELNLFEIDQKLRDSPGDTHQVVPLLADLKDGEAIGRIFQQHMPEIVFHAAAYKHVHLVELNPLSAILNNIQSMKNLLDCCERTSVESFVLISSDKAVNPVGVMGSTKRVCELMVAEAGRRTQRRYCAVRFGNVLGSSGSLIPLLTRQIQAGQPITITHKDMTRYFMLIPEAVSLVLKASAIASPGDVTILRMGDPIKVVDIAKNLIMLMGKTESDVPIVFTGLRPGEKMFEELYFSGDEIQTTDPDILIVPACESEMDEHRGKLLVATIADMILRARSGDPSALLLLSGLVKQYSTTEGRNEEIDWETQIPSTVTTSRNSTDFH
jgi:FlaA1/EpsC-like NDP-sugar epimerase